MTREQFEKKAIREAERQLGAPPGWWGTYRDVRGPKGERVRFNGSYWAVSVGGTRIGLFERAYGIKKAANWLKT